jgi:hypothetical protein
MLDEFVEVMIAFYDSCLDMDTEVLHNSVIKHTIYRGTNFKEYLNVYIYTSNQTKGFYIDHVIEDTNTVLSNINVYEVPNLIRQWDAELPSFSI